MKTSFTPGPWEVCHAGTGKNGKFEVDEYYVSTPGAAMAICADVIDPATGKISESNARLIAAAPDMLGLLRDAYSVIASEVADGESTDLAISIRELVAKVIA